ncbi:MAG: hypothetical protein AB8H86_15755 [Polyangiales bacterium]
MTDSSPPSRRAADPSAPRRDAFATLFFPLFALVGIAATVSRFDEVMARVPELFIDLILFVQVPLLCVAGLLEVRARGVKKDSGPDLPEWMKMQGRWKKAAFTFSFTALAIAALQVLDVELGPADPSPPPEWELSKRAQYFAMTAFGMGMVNYMAAVDMLLPPLRFLAKPFRTGVLWATVPFMLLIGAGIAAGFVYVVEIPVVSDGIAQLTTWMEEPYVVIGMIVGPILLAQMMPSKD